MSVPPPASPLITPDLRRRLQQRYEEAVRLLNQRPVDHARVHELLAECIRADPGNILYLDALLANLRQWQPSGVATKGGWLTGWSWFGGGGTAGTESTCTEYSVLSTQYLADAPIDPAAAHRLLLGAPGLLHDSWRDSTALSALSAACATCDFDQAEIRYLQVALDTAPNDAPILRMLARALTRQGQFDEAAPQWLTVQNLHPDTESEQAVADLQAAIDYESADRLLAEAGAAKGENLTTRREREDLRLSRAEQQVAIARRRAASDPHPKAQSIVSRLEVELRSQQIEVLHLRCERLPGDMHLRLELARKLKQAGNYSGAIQRLEEARSDPGLAAEVLLELGECWQHLRQFEKALDFYRQAVAVANEQPEPRLLALALYRVGVLAAAMGKNGEARQALAKLVAIEPGYKDARERLDKVPAN
jgi:tetratricopeptide (TPR) repeat protein